MNYEAHDTEEMLYILYEGDTPTGYVYGPPWVAQAAYMDDWRWRDTPEEAKEAWERYKAKYGNG